MRVKTWKILDWGDVPQTARTVELTCECGRDAHVPVVGLPIAQIGSGLVFDIGYHATPTTIQCRKCGRVLTTEKESPSDVR